MIFKTKATLTCRRCGFTKIFNSDADISTTDIKDSEDIAAWAEDSINLNRVAFEGVCPHCTDQKAA